MDVVGLWILFSVAVGVLASSRGRSGFGWFIFSLIFTPFIGLIFVLVLKQKPDVTEVDRPNPWTHVRCPDCRELVLKDARKCKHCGCALIPQ